MGFCGTIILQSCRWCIALHLFCRASDELPYEFERKLGFKLGCQVHLAETGHGTVTQLGIRPPRQKNLTAGDLFAPKFTPPPSGFVRSRETDNVGEGQPYVAPPLEPSRSYSPAAAVTQCSSPCYRHTSISITVLRPYVVDMR